MKSGNLVKSNVARITEAERKEYANFVYKTIIPTHGGLRAFLDELLKKLMNCNHDINREFASLLREYVIDKYDETLNDIKSIVDSGSTSKDTEAALVKFYIQHRSARAWAVKIPQIMGELDDMRATEQFEELAKLDDKFFGDVRDFCIVRPNLREETVGSGEGMDIRIHSF